MRRWDARREARRERRNGRGDPQRGRAPGDRRDPPRGGVRLSLPRGDDAELVSPFTVHRYPERVRQLPPPQLLPALNGQPDRRHHLQYRRGRRRAALAAAAQTDRGLAVDARVSAVCPCARRPGRARRRRVARRSRRIRELAGHADIRTTTIYTDVADERLEDAIDTAARRRKGLGRLTA